MRNDLPVTGLVYLKLKLSLSVVRIPYLLETLGEHIGTFLLIDEDDDGRINATVEDGDELVPLVIFLANMHHLHYHNLLNNVHYRTVLQYRTCSTLSTGRPTVPMWTMAGRRR